MIISPKRWSFTPKYGDSHALKQLNCCESLFISNPPACQNYGEGRGSSQFGQCQDFESAWWCKPSLLIKPRQGYQIFSWVLPHPPYSMPGKIGSKIFRESLRNLLKFCPVQKAIFIFVKLPKGRLHPTLPEMLKHEISESEYQIIIMTMIIIIIIRMAMMMFWRYADRCDWPNGGHFQLTADTSPRPVLLGAQNKNWQIQRQRQWQRWWQWQSQIQRQWQSLADSSPPVLLEAQNWFSKEQLEICILVFRPSPITLSGPGPILPQCLPLKDFLINHHNHDHHDHHHHDHHH